MNNKIIQGVVFICELVIRKYQSAKKIFAVHILGDSNGISSNRHGFSLLELMVSMSVLLVLLASVSAALTSGNRLWGISQAQTDISASARNALYRMAEELSQAGRNTVNISPGSDIITFQTPASFTGGDISWGNQIQYSLGGLNGQQLLHTDLVTTDLEIWGNYITLLRFNRIAVDTIEIQLSISKQSVKGDILTMQLGSQIQMRN